MSSGRLLVAGLQKIARTLLDQAANKNIPYFQMKWIVVATTMFQPMKNTRMKDRGYFSGPINESAAKKRLPASMKNPK